MNDTLIEIQKLPQAKFYPCSLVTVGILFLRKEEGRLLAAFIIFQIFWYVRNTTLPERFTHVDYEFSLSIVGLASTFVQHLAVRSASWPS